MFIRKKGEGPNARVYLQQSFREGDKVKTKIVANLGTFGELTKDDPDAFEKLKAKYQAPRKEKLTRETEAAKLMLSADSLPGHPSARAPSVSYANQILMPLWKELGLPKNLDALQEYHNPDLGFRISGTAAAICALKTWDPGSVRKAYRHKADLLGAPFNGVSLDQMYFVLDFLNEHKDTILKGVNRVLDAGLNRTHSMVFYDVTNAYFECALTDEERGFLRDYCQEDVERILRDGVRDGLLTESIVNEMLAAKELDITSLPDSIRQNLRCMLYLRMRGLSKEHRFDLPLISIALVIDDNAIPIDYEIYAGCASEYKTMSASIKKMKEKYGVKRTIVVADRGLNSTENMQMLLDEGHGFLVAQKISNLKPEERRMMLDPEGYTEHIILKDTSKLATEDNVKDRIKFKVIDFEKHDKKKGLKVSCKLVLIHSHKRMQRDLAQIEADLVKARDAISKGKDLTSSPRGWMNYIKVPKNKKIRAEELNQAAIDKKTQEAGYAGVIYHGVPGLENESPSAEQIKHSYHPLVQIEDCFRVMKHNTGLRPMFVRTEEHINGHVMCCVLALIMLRLLQMKLKEIGKQMTIEEITSALSDARLTIVPGKDGGDIFISTSCYQQMYVDRERLSDDRLRSILESEGVTYGVDSLLQCQGLSPLPTACNRQSLNNCLRMRLPAGAPIIDPIVYDWIAGKINSTSPSSPAQS